MNPCNYTHSELALRDVFKANAQELVKPAEQLEFTQVAATSTR